MLTLSCCATGRTNVESNSPPVEDTSICTVTDSLSAPDGMCLQPTMASLSLPLVFSIVNVDVSLFFAVYRVMPLPERSALVQWFSGWYSSLPKKVSRYRETWSEGPRVNGQEIQRDYDRDGRGKELGSRHFD